MDISNQLLSVKLTAINWYRLAKTFKNHIPLSYSTVFIYLLRSKAFTLRPGALGLICTRSCVQPLGRRIYHNLTPSVILSHGKIPVNFSSKVDVGTSNRMETWDFRKLTEVYGLVYISLPVYIFVTVCTTEFGLWFIFIVMWLRKLWRDK